MAVVNPNETVAERPVITDEGRAAIVSLGKKMETTVNKLAKTDPAYAAIIGEVFDMLNDLFEE